MIVADAVKETHSVGTAQTRSSDTAESVSDSQSVYCTTLFSLSQKNYRSNIITDKIIVTIPCIDPADLSINISD